MPGHHHRSGGLKQTNKKNKRSKSSKRSFTRDAGGKVNRRLPNNQKSLLAQSKADRRHTQQQRRDAKREELLRRKRGVSGLISPSRIIGIVSLGSTESIEEKLRSAILAGANGTEKTLDGNTTITAKFDVHKKDGILTILTNSTAFRGAYDTDEASAVLAALDLCRVCDMIVFVIDSDESKLDHDVIDMHIGAEESSSIKTNQTYQKQNWDHLISERGDRVLNAIKAQGMPSILTVLAHTEPPESARGDDFMSVRSAKSVRRSETKRSLNLKKYASRFASTEFGPDNDKVVEIDLSSDFHDEDSDAMDGCELPTTKQTDAAALVRILCTKAAFPSKWVSLSPRPYLLSDSHKYDAEKQELYITGYLRGMAPFSVNSLVHIPNIGTFACKSLRKSDLPFSRLKTMTDVADSWIVEADPSQQESLDMFATPDSLEGEQNLVGFDEDVEDASEDENGAPTQPGFSRPAGWSDYQSAWLDAVDDIGAEEGAIDHGELANELNKGSNKDTASLAPNAMELDDANDISAEERRLLMEQRRKEQNEHQQFPDEVDVDEDANARDRFARYRSLKSFKKTYWDPKENLPDTYGTVYHFANFKATQRSVMQDLAEVIQSAADLGESLRGSRTTKKQNRNDDVEMNDDSDDDDILDGCVPSGSYVTLTVQGVLPDAIKSLSPSTLITAVALLPHENKVSVLHAGLSHSMGCDDLADVPVKSKDVLTFRCGWRTWQARPVFSQHNLNCDKHKFERFMPQKGAFFASAFFGPVTYTPCPVLVFRERNDKPKELVAVGSMIGADAERIVVKRIILTGYPVRVHKRHATVKYMFYNPEDVKWFKPAGLWTKHGLNGNIVESVGEHGTMKCLFNAPIKQHDTVCLPLYKRIFPKFAPVSVDGNRCDDVASRATKREKNTLIVR